PTLRWSGNVSTRFSCAVKPLAAHAATPNTPLPRSIDCLGCSGGCPSTMFERRTRFAVSTLNLPPLHAVVGPAAQAPGAAPAANARHDSPAANRDATTKRLIRSLLLDLGPSRTEANYGVHLKGSQAIHSMFVPRSFA